MPVYSIIKKSELEGALRLDAEYYQPEYLDLQNSLSRFSIFRVGDIADVVYGTTPSGGEFENKGIPFVRSQNFSQLFIEDDVVYCSEIFHKKNSKSKIISGDILFAAVGATIGELAIVQEDIREANINQNIAAVKINNKKFISEFVGVFFFSKYGQDQIQRLVTGNAQFYLNSEQIKNFIVPVLDIKEQQEVANFVKNAQKELKNSKAFYSQAEQLLLKELGLENFEAENDLFSIVKFSDVKKTGRMDAEYFQGKYEKLISKIKSGKYNLLGDLVLIKKGVEIGAEQYQEQDKAFIRVSSLSKQGIIDKDQKYLNDALYQNLKKDFEPKIGEILLTKDATPGIAYVLKEKVEGIISSGILRLKLKQEIEAEYLALFINSILGQMQTERDAGGSIILHWKPEQVKNLVVPILSQETQQEIAQLVKKSHQARQKAKELLEQAKQKVENLIEK